MRQFQIAVGLADSSLPKAGIGSVARFCGLSPRNASSGRRMADAGLIKAGDDLLKSVLIEAAHRLRRYDSRWKEFGQELAKRGKHGSVIAAAVANRWVRGLFHQMKEDPA